MLGLTTKIGMFVRTFAIALICLLAAASPTLAQSPNPTEPPPTLEAKTIKFMPPLKGIMAAGVRSGLRAVSTRVNVTYDEVGNVLAATLDEPTGNKSLDKAILAWAAKVKISAQGAGSGSIPIKMKLDR